MKRFRGMLVALLLAAASPAHAAPYLDAASFDPAKLTPPPAVQSAEWNKDIDTIHALQAQADPEAVKQAAEEYSMKPELLTLPVNPAITRAAYPKLYALLDRVGETSRAITDRAKKFWNTKRPYLSDTRVKALIASHSNAAYPSGHTSGSLLWAETLGLVFPASREAYLARAEAIAQHRVLAGMHYPHDVVGGKELAQWMFAELQRNTEFQHDLAQARDELAQHTQP